MRMASSSPERAMYQASAQDFTMWLSSQAIAANEGEWTIYTRDGYIFYLTSSCDTQYLKQPKKEMGNIFGVVSIESH